MNVNDVKKYMIEADKHVFRRVLDFRKIVFVGSNDDGIIVDFANGIHTLNIGNNVNKAQINRVLILVMLDSIMNIKNEEERDKLGELSYNEYGDRIGVLQAKFFPVDHVYVENSDIIVKDEIIECGTNTCTLRKLGTVNKENIIGLKCNESKIRK
jgi:hypothetical protein